MAHREGIREFLKDVDLKGLKVIDWGCGTKPIKNYLKGAYEYYGIDKLEHVGADLVIDFGNGDPYTYVDGYDVAFCLEVLEHVDFPETALTNIYNSLRKRGFLYLSVPFLYPVHSDEDLWRFTDQGLRRLLERNGFKVLEIQATTPENNGWVVKAMKI